MEDFHDILKKLRIDNGYTQGMIADKLNISRSTVSMYEAGIREPSCAMLEAIADLFNVDVDYLLGRTRGTIIFSEADYYMNEYASELARFLLKNPEYKVLFEASRKIKKEDIAFVKQILDRIGCL